jgi:CRISPR-associated protein Csd1
MILQALHEYYLRKGDLAPEGFEWIELPFLIVIDSEGHFIALEDTREGDGKVKRGKLFLLPKAKSRSGSRSYAVTQFLWDHLGYLLGHPKSDSPNDIELANNQHASWLRALEDVPSPLGQDPHIVAMRKSYLGELIHGIRKSSNWVDCQKIQGCNLAFRLDGETEPIPCTEVVRRFIGDKSINPDDLNESDPEIHMGTCLITGQQAVIARLHSRTPISKDSRSLVNFQKGCGYDSYGKEQGFNAPVSKSAEAAYTTALKSLLSRDSTQNMHVGDTTTVFWSDKKSDFENQFASYFGLAEKGDPDAGTRAIKALYESPFTGSPSLEADARFFVLGLAPNSARISVRFWIQGTIQKMASKLRQHFDDLEIALSVKDPGNRALMSLLCDLVLERKADNIPPNLAGATVCAALTGGLYPQTLLHLAVRRNRAEQTVTRMRAAVLKAVLNRSHRLNPTSEKEITVSLDSTNVNPGYRLGRLFAVLEKIQEDAQPGINTTIRDRFYGAASSSPASVFPQLLKLKNHHLAKLENPSFRGSHEKRLTEIFDGIVEIPHHLRMEEQARFAIGYYHQRQALFTKTPKMDTTLA